jgi:RNA polymerase sigma-70 factor (ECF subfamily)
MSTVVEPFLVDAARRSGPVDARRPAAVEPEPTQLAVLLDAVARGDEVALGELHRRTATRMGAMTYRVLRDRELADEAVQDAFVRIWQHAATYSHELSAPMTWMLTIARNRALDLLRRRARELAWRGSPDEQVEYEAIASEAPGPEARVSLASELRGLQDVLSVLGESERRALELAFVEERTNAEIAAAMRAPLGTVKRWIRRSLARLRAAHGLAVEDANVDEQRSELRSLQGSGLMGGEVTGKAARATRTDLDGERGRRRVRREGAARGKRSAFIRCGTNEPIVGDVASAAGPCVSR